MQYPKRCDPPPLAPKEETKYGQVWKRRRSLRRFELKVN